MTWTIEARAYSLGPYNHLYIEVWDYAGDRVEQINGFSSLSVSEGISSR